MVVGLPAGNIAEAPRSRTTGRCGGADTTIRMEAFTMEPRHRSAKVNSEGSRRFTVARPGLATGRRRWSSRFIVAVPVAYARYPKQCNRTRRTTIKIKTVIGLTGATYGRA